MELTLNLFEAPSANPYCVAILGAIAQAITIPVILWIFYKFTNRLSLKELRIPKEHLNIGEELGRLKPELIDLNPLKISYILVRHGTDTYVEKIASVLDRHHCRLQNKTKELELKSSYYSLKVHSRLGTQVKFFTIIDKEKSRAIGLLKNRRLNHILIEDCVDVLDSDKIVIYFRIVDRKQYMQVQTIEKFWNNYLFFNPVTQK